MRPLRYPIRAVAKLTGISVDTLRVWERRYGVVSPERDERGRLYSDEDVERLKLLRDAVARGHAIGRVSAFDTAELRRLLARSAPSDPAAGSAVPADLSALQAAVDRFDAAALRRELSRLAAILPVRAMAREVALPFLHLVGEAWHEGKLTAAQEHLVSAELRSLIGTLTRVHAPADDAPPLVLATPTTERHELGTMVAALVAAGAGYAPVYLGPDLPAADIVAAARRTGAHAVVLGLTAPGADAAAIRCVADVARDLPAGVALWVGGAGAPEVPRAGIDRALILVDFDAFERELAKRRT